MHHSSSLFLRFLSARLLNQLGLGIELPRMDSTHPFTPHTTDGHLLIPFPASLFSLSLQYRFFASYLAAYYLERERDLERDLERERERDLERLRLLLRLRFRLRERLGERPRSPPPPPVQ